MKKFAAVFALLVFCIGATSCTNDTTAEEDQLFQAQYELIHKVDGHSCDDCVHTGSGGGGGGRGNTIGG